MRARAVDALSLPQWVAVSSPTMVQWSRRWRDAADTEAREKLVRAVWPWAIDYSAFLVRHYPAWQGEDLLSEAVLSAVDTHDPDRGALTGWVVWWLRAVFSRQQRRPAIKQQPSPVRLSEAADEQAAWRELLRCASGLLARLEDSDNPHARFLVEYCRGVSLAEMGRRRGVSRQWVAQLKKQALRWLRTTFPDTKGMKRFERYASPSDEAAATHSHCRCGSRPRDRHPSWLRCARELERVLHGQALSLPEIRGRLPHSLAMWASRAVVARPSWFARIAEEPLPRWQWQGKEGPDSEQR